jgi:hypothetical protein
MQVPHRHPVTYIASFVFVFSMTETIIYENPRFHINAPADDAHPSIQVTNADTQI